MYVCLFDSFDERIFMRLLAIVNTPIPIVKSYSPINFESCKNAQKFACIRLLGFFLL